MENERWAQIERLYHAALELDPKDRPTFLAKACAGDDFLRHEVESLLESDSQAGSFIESPAIEVAARFLAEQGLPGTTSSALEAGTTISHYRLIAKLGRGGMGEVYRASDLTLGRDVALKFLPDEFLEEPQKLERFRREAWAASALNHPNICTIYEIGEHEGRLFIAMELVEGKTLAEKLKDGPLSIERVLSNSRQIAEALEEAHEHNIIHRDLKPANVMVTAKGRVKVLDFGLAKLMRPVEADAPTEESLFVTQAGAVMGTVPYMAPEQLRGDPVDARTDLYALGELIYEMSTGHRPFPETHTSHLISAILTRNPRHPRELNPQISEELEAIILKAMAKDPAQRYQTARDVMEDLGPPDSSLRLSVSGTKSTALPPPGPRRNWMLALIAGISVSVCALLVVLLVPSVRQHLITSLSTPGGHPGQKELAVLPFSVIGGNAGDDAFGRGLAETLSFKITQLSSGQPLRVVSFDALAASHVATAREAQEKFGANLVLTGNLERAGDRVRVSYALVDPSTNRQVSADTLTLSMSDPFGIEDQVVEGTATMLGLTVENAQRQEVESHGTQVASAFQDYVKGLGYLQNYETAKNVDKAIDSFRSALKVDTTYTLAYAALGQAYWRKYDMTEDTSWMGKAQESCSHAVTLNSKLADTRLCQGIMKGSTGHYLEAIEEFQQVLDLQPFNTAAYEGLANAQYNLNRTSDAETTYERAISVRPDYWAPYNWLGVLYIHTGQTEKAAAMFRKVIQLSPGNHQGFYNLCGADYTLGKWDEAKEVCKKSIAIHPSAAAYSNIGTIMFYEGQYPESVEYFEKAVKLQPKGSMEWGNLADAYRWSPGGQAKARAAYLKAASLVREGLRVNPNSYPLMGDLAMYEAKSSDIHQAMRDISKALASAPKDFQIMYDAAIVYHLAGQQTKALDYLGRALNGGYPVRAIRTDPEWTSLKGDPAFQKLIAEAK